MRYENLEWNDKMKLFRRLHRRLNKGCFKGCLKEVVFSIENLNKKDPEVWAVFRRPEMDEDQASELLDSYDSHEKRKIAMAYIQRMTSGQILFSYEFEDDIKSLRTQKQQVGFLTMVMLHEMIHQCCFEYGIDDTDHSEEWQKTAEEHGLHSIWNNGENVEEWLTFSWVSIVNFRIR